MNYNLDKYIISVFFENTLVMNCVKVFQITKNGLNLIITAQQCNGELNFL